MTDSASHACLADEQVAFRLQDIDYLHVDGQTFQATIYQPEGQGPFPAIVDVHGGAWMRDDVRRNEHALMNERLAAMGIVVVAIDFRQSAQHHYPDSVADVNFAIRWVRANATKFNASSQSVGAFGSSSGGHLVLLNSMRPCDHRYAALPMAGIAQDDARPDYIIIAYPISDPHARRKYAQEVGNDAIVNFTDCYFSPAKSIFDGNPHHILDSQTADKLPPALLLQGSPSADGVILDKNVSPEIQRQFATAYHRAGGKLQLELLPGAPHNFVNTAGADLNRALALMKDFIAQQLRYHERVGN
ncbi:MAG TPA: alpha/beta hydrolase [Burkholderiaceae bacterium]|jgi:acetyl esterase/lipase